MYDKEMWDKIRENMDLMLKIERGGYIRKHVRPEDIECTTSDEMTQLFNLCEWFFYKYNDDRANCCCSRSLFPEIPCAGWGCYICVVKCMLRIFREKGVEYA